MLWIVEEGLRNARCCADGIEVNGGAFTLQRGASYITGSSILFVLLEVFFKDLSRFVARYRRSGIPDNKSHVDLLIVGN
jgi:hypothetical protein